MTIFSVITPAGVTYYLNTKMVLLNGGKEHPIYFFSKDERPATGCELPEGYEPKLTSRGLPVLKKVK